MNEGRDSAPSLQELSGLLNEIMTSEAPSTEVLERIGNCAADFVAATYGLERARIQRILEGALDSSKSGGGGKSFRSFWRDGGLGIFQQAFWKLPPPDAVELFERDNVLTVAERVTSTYYLANGSTPLYGLQDLEPITRTLIERLQLTREHLIKTGYPSVGFNESMWMQERLCHLYHVKQCGPIDESDDGPNNNYQWQYSWCRFPGDIRTETDTCRYEEAGYRRGLNASDAERLEEARERFLDLKVAVVRELLGAVERRSETGLWKSCLSLLTDSLMADDVDFFLRMDRVYDVRAVFDAGTGETGYGHRTLAAGGLSDLLYVIGHYEKELSFQVLARTRDALGPLVLTSDCDREIEGNLERGSSPPPPRPNQARCSATRAPRRRIRLALVGRALFTERGAGRHCSSYGAGKGGQARTPDPQPGRRCNATAARAA